MKKLILLDAEQLQQLVQKEQLEGGGGAGGKKASGGNATGAGRKNSMGAESGANAVAAGEEGGDAEKLRRGSLGFAGPVCPSLRIPTAREYFTYKLVKII